MKVSQNVFLFFLSISVLKTSFSQQNAHPQNNKNLSILLLHSLFPSHFFPLISLGAELTKRGHTVTTLGPVLEEYEDKMRTLVENKGMIYTKSSLISTSHFQAFREMAKFNSNSTLSIIADSIQFMRNISTLFNALNYFSSTIKVLDMLNKTKYDYIIAEQAVGPLLYYLSDKWNTTNIMLLMLQLELTPRYTIPYPYPRYGCPFEHDMNFIQRLINTVIFAPLEKTLLWLISRMMPTIPDYDKPQHSLLDGTLQQPTLYNTVLGILEGPKTRLPLQHYIGPMLLHDSSLLGKSLAEWIHDSDSPIIVISMGTTAEVSKEMAADFLSLTSTGYRLVWSLRESNQDILADLSINNSNVYISPWIAQFTLLREPLVQIAILHCGLNGVQEALYNEVPVLCVPYGIDQLDTASKLNQQKLGISLAPSVLNQDSLRQSVELLKGEFYRKQAKKASRLLKAGGGVKKGADLVELYAEIGYQHGLPSFISYQWSSIQYYNIDVWLALVSLLLLTLWACNKWGRKCCCCCKRCHKEEKKEKLM